MIYRSLEGTRVRILETDDGSGWIKIINDETGNSGLVPVTYVKDDGAEDNGAPSTKLGSLMQPSVSHTYSDSRSSMSGASFLDGGDAFSGSGTFGVLMNLNFNLQSLDTNVQCIV